MRALLATLSLVATGLCAACGGGGNGPQLEVYAAASLRDALEEVGADWEAQGGAPLLLNAASSGRLAQQLLAAERADVFLSASEDWMDRVEEAGLLAPDTRRDLLSNRLAVVVPVDAPAREVSADLAAAGFASIAIGQVEAVPAGRYARDWLERSGAWERVAPALVPTANARAALALVERGAVEAGIVYATDAASSEAVRVAYAVPSEDGPRIAYPCAALARAAEPDAARAFLAFLEGPGARAVFAAHGFPPPPSAAGMSTRPLPSRSSAESLRRALRALGVTLKVALLGTLLAAGPGIAVGLLLARRRGLARAALAALAQLPLVFPAVAVGLLLLLALPRPLLVTWWAASLAAAVMAFPLVAHAAAAAFEEVDPRLEAMAETLGLSRARALARVTFPLARRGLAASVLLGFGRALGEFGATVVVAGNVPGRTQTLALAIYEDVDLGRYREALVPVALAAVLALASVAAAQLLRGRGRARPGEEGA